MFYMHPHAPHHPPLGQNTGHLGKKITRKSQKINFVAHAPSKSFEIICSYPWGVRPPSTLTHQPNFVSSYSPWSYSVVDSGLIMWLIIITQSHYHHILVEGGAHPQQVLVYFNGTSSGSSTMMGLMNSLWVFML